MNKFDISLILSNYWKSLISPQSRFDTICAFIILYGVPVVAAMTVIGNMHWGWLRLVFALAYCVVVGINIVKQFRQSWDTLTEGDGFQLKDLKNIPKTVKTWQDWRVSVSYWGLVAFFIVVWVVCRFALQITGIAMNALIAFLIFHAAVVVLRDYILTDAKAGDLAKALDSPDDIPTNANHAEAKAATAQDQQVSPKDDDVLSEHEIEVLLNFKTLHNFNHTNEAKESDGDSIFRTKQENARKPSPDNGVVGTSID